MTQQRFQDSRYDATDDQLIDEIFRQLKKARGQSRLLDDLSDSPVASLPDTGPPDKALTPSDTGLKAKKTAPTPSDPTGAQALQSQVTGRKRALNQELNRILGEVRDMNNAAVLREQRWSKADENPDRQFGPVYIDGGVDVHGDDRKAPHPPPNSPLQARPL